MEDMDKTKLKFFARWAIIAGLATDHKLGREIIEKAKSWGLLIEFADESEASTASLRKGNRWFDITI